MFKDKKIIIIIAIVAAIAIIASSAVVIALLVSDDTTPETSKTTASTKRPAGGIYYDPSQGEYDPNKPGYTGGNKNGVAIPGFGSWTIPPKVTKVRTDFFNPEDNEYKYDLTFEVRIPNNSAQGYEVVYTSGLVKAGNHIQEVTLSRSFEKGEYNAVLHVQPYTADDDHIPLNNANINFTLIVK